MIYKKDSDGYKYSCSDDSKYSHIDMIINTVTSILIVMIIIIIAVIVTIMIVVEVV